MNIIVKISNQCILKGRKKERLQCQIFDTCDFWQKYLNNIELQIWFCNKDEITEMNRNFRGLEKPTDVLSWYMEGEFDENNCGMVAICQEICFDQAVENGWGFEVEAVRLLAHGLAHVLGFDHQTEAEELKMLTMEENLLRKAGYCGIYS